MRFQVTDCGASEWCEALVEIGHKADLFVTEAYFRDTKVPLHLDLKSLEKALPRSKPKCLIPTHMSDDMLARREALSYVTAEDGMIVEL